MFVIFSATVGLPPTVTLPKAILAGLEASVPGAAVDPVPLSETLVWESDASLPISMVAVNVPIAFGENVKLIGVLCPAAIETGRLGEVMEKYLVVMETLLTLTVAAPEFVALTITVLLLPGATLPKASEVLAMESVPTAGVELAALTPWQPARIARLARSRRNPAAFSKFLAELPVVGAIGIMRVGPSHGFHVVSGPRVEFLYQSAVRHAQGIDFRGASRTCPIGQCFDKAEAQQKTDLPSRAVGQLGTDRSLRTASGRVKSLGFHRPRLGDTGKDAP